MDGNTARRRSAWGRRALTVALVASVAVFGLPESAHALAAPVVTTHPSSKSVPFGVGVTFTSTATGDPTPTVQWQRNSTGTWVDITGATSTTYGTTATTSMGIRAVFTNSQGTATSNVATLNVSGGPPPTPTPPVITTQPSSPTVVMPNSVSLSANASGYPQPTVQWQRGISIRGNPITWSNISGATSYTYGFAPSTSSGGYYRAIFTNASGTATTDTAIVTILWAPSISLDAGYTPVVQFPLTDANATHQGTIWSSESSNPSATITWDRSNDGGSTWTPVVGDPDNLPSYILTTTLGAADDNTLFRVTATNAYGSASATTTARVGVPPTITQEPGRVYAAAGSTAKFTSAATAGATVQWSWGTGSPTVYTDIPGGTDPTVTVVAPTTNRNIRATWTNAYGTATSFITNGFLYSLPAVDPPGTAPYVTVQPPDEIELQIGETATVTVEAGGDPATVQWYYGGSGQPIAGATSNQFTYTGNNLISSYSVTAKFTNAYGNTSTEYVIFRNRFAPWANAADKTSKVALTSPTQTQNISVLVGLLGNPTPDLQFQRSTDGGATWADIAGADGDSYSPLIGLSMNGYKYRAVGTNIYGTAAGPVTTMDVGVQPTFSQSPVNQTVAAGTVATFSSTVTGTEPMTVTWYRSTTSNGTYVLVPGCTGTTCSFVATMADSGYWYRGTVTNGYGSGHVSTARLLTVTPSVPMAPTGASATPAIGQASVSWTIPFTDGGQPITSYVVTPYIGAVAQAPKTVPAPATGTTVTGLTNGATYTFTVAAVSSLGTGAASSASAPITLPTVPGAPSGVSAVAGIGQATVSWTTPSDGGQPVTGYVVTPSENGVPLAPTAVPAPATEATLTGLTNGASYTFTVAAVNGVGTGATSSPSAAITLPTTPGTPTGVAAVAGNTRATVSWGVPSDGGHAILGYLVTPSKNGVPQTPTTVSAPATDTTVSGLTNGAGYTFTVAAVNTLGAGSASAPSNSVTPVGIVLSSNANPSVIGQSVTLRVDSTVGTMGTVRFYDGATLLGSKLMSTGSVTFPTTKLTLGAHTLSATFQRNTASPLHSSDPLAQEVDPGTTTTTLTATPATAVFGEAVKLRAAVDPVAPAAGTRTGGVQFFDGATLIGTVNLASGAATLTAKLPVGSHPITAVYLGSGSWVGSASPTTTLDVAPASTATVVTSTANPSVSGQSVTIKAKVTAVAPGAGTITGSIDLYDGVVLVGTKPLASGAASFALKPSVGSHDFVAVYSGATSFATSSGSLTQVVDQAATKVVLTSSRPNATAGQTGTMTATVTNIAPGAGTVTGSVEFSVNGTVIHTATISGGKATMSITLLGVGVHDVVATYLGDATHAGSASPPFTQTIS